MSLFIKIFLSLIISIIISFGFYITVIINFEKKSYEINLQEKIKYNEQIYSSSISVLLYELNKEVIRTLLQSILKDKEIERIQLIDYSNIINLNYKKDSFKEKNTIKNNIFLSFANENIGELNVFYTEKHIEEKLASYKQNILVFSIILSIFLLLVLYYSINKFTKSIVTLTRSSSYIASGDLSKEINIKTNDEIGILAQKFDLMRKKLKDRIEKNEKQAKEIEQLNNNLQKKVEERTVELKEQKEVFETLFNESKDGLVLIKDEKFYDCNETILNTLKLEKKSDFIGLTPYDLSPEFQPNGRSSKEAMKENIVSCMKKGSERFEWICKDRFNNNFWTEIIITKILLHGEVVIYSILRDISDKKELETEIHNKNLDLQESNDELEVTIENLKQTQNKLVESEKMASLGSLVAGVAHEINTPVGIGLTGITHFLTKTKELKNSYHEERMSQDEFEEYLKTSEELANLINLNLQRTAQLVKTFKKVSFDQSSEEKRKINLKDYIDETLFSINNVTKKTNINIENNCDEDINIQTYPGAIYQIITNLIFNSLNHGFQKDDVGNIKIYAKKDSGFIKLKYIDDGKGIEKENLKKIFELFFTTNRNNGGTGLGLNILYNIISNTLHGTIICNSEKNKGVEFLIKFKELD